MGTLGTLRELFEQQREWYGGHPRAWDLALWSGVSPQGTVFALERLRRIGLVEEVPPYDVGRARRYRLVHSHPLYLAFRNLFAAERAVSQRSRRFGRVPPTPPPLLPSNG